MSKFIIGRCEDENCQCRNANKMTREQQLEAALRECLARMINMERRCRMNNEPCFKTVNGVTEMLDVAIATAEKALGGV